MTQIRTEFVLLLYLFYRNYRSLFQTRDKLIKPCAPTPAYMIPVYFKYLYVIAALIYIVLKRNKIHFKNYRKK